MNQRDEALDAAVLRGYQKIEVEQQRKEAEQAAAETALREKWNQWIRRARERVPEVLRPYLTLSADTDQTYRPPQDILYYTVVFEFPGMMAPIRTQICLLENDPLVYEVPFFYLGDDDIIAYSWYRRAQEYIDLEIALAMASEEGMRANQEYERISASHLAAPEPTYEPVDQPEIAVNNPLVNELADFIRGIVDERLSEGVE